MRVNSKSWVSAVALLGILIIPNSSSTAGAQQETNAVAAAASFSLTTGIATDSTGDLYIANSRNTILKITHDGMALTLAGKPDERGSADGIGYAARFAFPIGIAIDSADDVYVTDKVNNTIRRIAQTGLVTTLAGTPGINGHADGVGTKASFSSPIGIATDKTGNVYVADSGNNIIRKITPAGVVTTIAGLAGAPGETDGIGAAARFSAPYGIATDGDGNLFVVEMSSNTLRKITPAGMVSTLAGKAGQPGHADGTGTDATFNAPHGVATDKAGNIYVADNGNNTIRKVTPAGVVTTIAGRAGTEDDPEFDGIGSAARFQEPTALTTDHAGNVLVLEGDNVRQVSPMGAVTTVAGTAFGPWHLQNQFCEVDVPPETGGSARSGTRRCSLNAGITYCSSSIEITSANPKTAKPKLSLVYDESNGIIGVDTKYKVERPAKEGKAAKDDPPGDDLGSASWLHYVVTITVSSTNLCK